MFSFGLWVDTFAKAVGHKYIKRIPYQHKGKRRYRYIYKVTHSHQGRHAFDEAHLKVGTAFSLNTKAGEEYHGHVTKIEGDKVSYRIDDGPEKGTVKTVSKRELLAKLNDVHDIENQLTSERDKLRNQIKEARENKASEKQIARLEARLKRLGGEAETEPPKTPRGHLSPSEMEEIERYPFDLLAEGKPEERNGYLREQDLSTIEAKLNDWKEYYADLKESEPHAYRRRRRFRQWRQFEQLKRYVRTRRAEGRLEGEEPPKAPAPEPVKQVKEQTPEEREAGARMFEQLFGYSLESGKQESEKQEREVIRGKITPDDLRQYKKIDTEGAGAFEKMSAVELERLEERLEDVRDTFSRRISSKVREFDRESGLDEATKRLKEAEFDWEHVQRVHGRDDEPRDGATYAQRKQFREARDAYERAEREHDNLFSKVESERNKIISNEDQKLTLLDPVLAKRAINDMGDLIAQELAERRAKEETKRTREEATRRQEAQRRKEAEETEKKGREVREMVTEAREIDRIIQEGGTGEAYENKSAMRGDYEAETPEERYKSARDNMSNVSDADDYKHAITQIKNLVDRGKVTIEQGYLLRRMLRGLNPLDKTPEELNTEEAEDYEVLSDASDVFNGFIDIYETE